MNVTITPRPLSGRVTPPPSKSQAHRLIIAAALAEGTSTLRNVAFSQDIEATLRCMNALGAQFTRAGSTLTVEGIGASPASGGAGELPRLDCGESGSTLRFLIPLALVTRGGGVFTGRGRLMERPQQPYEKLFGEQGVRFAQQDGVITVEGALRSGICALPGNVSSQFFTGLLYALPLLPGESYLKSTTPLESGSYLAMTLSVLRQAGVEAELVAGSSFLVKGGQRYQPLETAVEADWSQAAFWYAAQGMGGEVRLSGLNEHSAQGDRIIARWKERLDAAGDLTLDVSDVPDLVPPLAAWCALRKGSTTHIVNAARLRMKESDRLAAVTQVLTALGAQVEEGADSLTIHGVGQLRGGVTVSGHNDHRIAMMAAIAASRCTEPVTITGAQCVAKSYPDFWREYTRLGGEIEEREE